MLHCNTVFHSVILKCNTVFHCVILKCNIVFYSEGKAKTVEKLLGSPLQSVLIVVGNILPTMDIVFRRPHIKNKRKQNPKKLALKRVKKIKERHIHHHRCANYNRDTRLGDNKATTTGIRPQLLEKRSQTPEIAACLRKVLESYVKNNDTGKGAHCCQLCTHWYPMGTRGKCQVTAWCGGAHV